MKTDETTYIDLTPIELWRLGDRGTSRLNKMRLPPRPPGAKIDIRTFTTKEGELWVKAGTGGVSIFDGKNPKLRGTHWWRIPANSPIPSELKITKDSRKDKITGLTHYRIEPIFDMPLNMFIDLLTKFAKNAEKSFSETEIPGKEKI